MVAPSLSGLTVLGAFNTAGTRVGTIVAGSGAASASEIYQNPATGDYLQKLGIEGVGSLCNSVVIENLTASSVQGGVRFTTTQLGAASPLNFSTDKFIIHISTFDISQIATRANGAAQMRVFSNSGFTIYREYLIYGSDSDFVSSAALKRNGEAWQAIIIDLTNASLANATVGAFDASTIHAFQFLYKPSVYSQITPLRYFFHDLFCASNGLVLTNGDITTPGKFNDFHVYSDAVTVEAFLVPNLGSTYGSKIPLIIGDGSTSTRAEDSDKFLEFAEVHTTTSNPQQIILPTSYLGLTINQSSSDYLAFKRISIGSSSKWKLVISGSTSATFMWNGGVLSNVGTNQLEGSANFNGVIFSRCDRLNPSSSRSFMGCTISDSTDAVASFAWNGTQDLTSANFTNNITPAGAIQVTSAGTYNLVGVTFSGNTKNFNVTATTGEVIIYYDAASTSDLAWSSSFVTGGATVSILAAPTYLTLGVTGAPPGGSIGVFKRSAPLIADRNQFTLTAGNNNGNSTLIVNTTLPLDTPASGFVRIVRSSGVEDRLPYTSYSGSTFTLSTTLPVSYSAGDSCYVGYLDVLNSTLGNESNIIQFVTNRDCVLVVRKGSGLGKIRDVRENFILTSSDAVIPVSGSLDSNNNA